MALPTENHSLGESGHVMSDADRPTSIKSAAKIWYKRSLTSTPPAIRGCEDHNRNLVKDKYKTKDPALGRCFRTVDKYGKLFEFVYSKHVHRRAVPMVQAVGHWSVTADARFQSHASPCRICGGQSDTGLGVSPSTPAYPYQYNFSMLIDSHVTDFVLILATDSIVK